MPNQREELDCRTVQRLCKGFDTDARYMSGAQHGRDFQVDYQEFPALNSRTCCLRIRAYDNETRALWLQALRAEAELIPRDLEGPLSGQTFRAVDDGSGDCGVAGEGAMGGGRSSGLSSGWAVDEGESSDESSDEGFVRRPRVSSVGPRGFFPQSDDEEDEEGPVGRGSSNRYAEPSRSGSGAPWWREAHMQPRDLLSPGTSPRARKDENESLQHRIHANKLQRKQQSGSRTDRSGALEAQLEIAKTTGRRFARSTVPNTLSEPKSSSVSDKLQAR